VEVVKRGDTVWVLRNGEWHRLAVRYIDRGFDGKSPPLVGLALDSGGTDHWPVPHLEAMQALRAATESVAKARDAVVERSVAWYEARPTIAGVTTAYALEEAVVALEEAERAEAEARARLEALR
jgi:hypothetical protein